MWDRGVSNPHWLTKDVISNFLLSNMCINSCWTRVILLQQLQWNKILQMCSNRDTIRICFTFNRLTYKNNDSLLWVGINFHLIMIRSLCLQHTAHSPHGLWIYSDMEVALICPWADIHRKWNTFFHMEPRASQMTKRHRELTSQINFSMFSF